jgi:type II secretory pathway pseudopilin PulG
MELGGFSLSTGETMTREPFKAKDGFTLVETVLSAMVLGIALGACILSFSMAMRAVNTAGNQMAALHTARDAMESLRTNSFSSSALAVGSSTFSNAYFTALYTVSSVDACNKTVAVSVSYLNRIHRGSSTNTLTTVLCSTLHP